MSDVIRRAFLGLVRNRWAVVVLVVSALLGPYLYLDGKTGEIDSRVYTTDGHVVLVGTAYVERCTRSGRVTLDGFGRHWTCTARATWREQRDYGAARPSQVTIEWSQVTGAQVGTSVEVTQRVRPYARGAQEFYIVVLPAPGADRGAANLSHAIEMLGMVVALPVIVLVVLSILALALLLLAGTIVGLNWVATRATGRSS